MKRYAGVRFTGALDETEREAATRLLRSIEARATSWKTAASRTYALVEFGTAAQCCAIADPLSDCFPQARIDVPPLVVLRVRPAQTAALARLVAALAGPGRPDGIVDVVLDRDALVIEFDARRTPLALVVALIDVELSPLGGRMIEPLLALGDETLAAFARDVLGIDALDSSRIIETHLEALLAEPDVPSGNDVPQESLR